MMLFILGTFYVTMVSRRVHSSTCSSAPWASSRTAVTPRSAEIAVRFDYTTVLNIVFLLVAGALVVRFVRTGGLPMLKVMGGDPSDGDGHGAGHGVSVPAG